MPDISTLLPLIGKDGAWAVFSLVLLVCLMWTIKRLLAVLEANTLSQSRTAEANMRLATLIEESLRRDRQP